MHAELTWTGERWCIRDLGSRNGTFVAGERIDPGSRVDLRPGTELAFASESCRFGLVDAGPPRLFASSGLELREGEDQLLFLPDSDAPSHTIYLDRDSRWVLESADETRALEDAEQVVAGGRSWRVSLPGHVAQTRTRGTTEVSLEAVQLRFTVSLDEEHIELRVASGTMLEHVIELEPRAHLALLLTLARLRINDANNPDLGPAEHGWTHRDDLTRMLAIEPELISLWIHRARKQLTKHGIRDAAWVVERRAGGTQLRIGVADLVVE